VRGFIFAVEFDIGFATSAGSVPCRALDRKGEESIRSVVVVNRHLRAACFPEDVFAFRAVNVGLRCSRGFRGYCAGDSLCWLADTDGHLDN